MNILGIWSILWLIDGNSRLQLMILNSITDIWINSLWYDVHILGHVYLPELHILEILDVLWRCDWCRCQQVLMLTTCWSAHLLLLSHCQWRAPSRAPNILPINFLKNWQNMIWTCPARWNLNDYDYVWPEGIYPRVWRGPAVEDGDLLSLRRLSPPQQGRRGEHSGEWTGSVSSYNILLLTVLTELYSFYV